MRPSRNKGLTLAELLFAAAILAFVLTGLLALFTNCIFLNETNRQRSIATSHAEFAMEEIKSRDFSTIRSYYDRTCWSNSAACSNACHGSTRNATIESKGLAALPKECICIRVTRVQGTANQLLQVVVTDAWSGRRQAPGVVLQTLITNY